MEHPIKRPSYDEHINELFTPDDARCMNRAIDLTTYEGVKSSAAKISEWIGSGRMPPPDTGRQWSPEKLETFRNWVSNTGFAEKSFVRLAPSEVPRVRKSLHDIETDSKELAILRKAFTGIMARDADTNDPTSFYSLAGIHWLPGAQADRYCRHHDNAYNPWHRSYLMAFENALRSVEGCENVTLPYWDILGEALPAWIYEPPFYPYEMPHKIVSLDGSVIYDVGYSTERNSAVKIVEEVKSGKASIESKIGEALASPSWRGFNGWSDRPNRHEGIIRAHDNGHAACGATIGNQDVAAFDPLFWFFHCNWDRLWWRWQNTHNTTTLLAFKATVTGDTHWLEEEPDTLLPPFDVNSAEMINLADWNVAYEDSEAAVPAFDEFVVASTGGARAERSFQVPTLERYSVRVKDINRLDIPGSFEVVLMSGEHALDRTRIFQPNNPRECENCKRHGVFSTDFIVDRSELSTDSDLRVAILVGSKQAEMTEFPLEKAGNPTINIRLLLTQG